MSVQIELEIFDVDDHEPGDGSLVVAWHNERGISVPSLREYRSKKKGFYSGEMPTIPNRFFYLSDLIGLEATQSIRDRWDQRDDRTKRRILKR